VAQRSDGSFSAVGYTGERRRKPRLQVNCSAVVRSYDGASERIEEDALLDNVSASGLHLQLSHPVERGVRLFVMFSLSNASSDRARAPRIAAHGVVLRAEPQPEGTYGLGIKLERYRLI